MMKQRLLRTLALGIVTLASATAWADRDTSKPIYCPVNDGSYDYIKEAFDAIKDNAATDLEIQIWGTRPKLGSVADSRITIPAGKTLSITPMVDGIILTAGSHNRGNIWFLNGQDNATFNIGSADHAMTIEGYGFNDSNRQFNAVCANEKKGVMNITNVTFQKFRFGVDGTKYGYIYANKVATTSATEGYVAMTDVNITNCETDNDAFINSINTYNDAICLKGSFTINHKEGKSEPVFSLKGRIKLGDKSINSVYNDFTATNLITIKWGGAATIGTNVIVKVPAAQAVGVFDVTNDGYGLVRSGGGGDMKLAQAYTLAVSDAGAATLVLPFEATIPAGASCFTLNYTAGKSTVKATEVETTLAANTPVLVNAVKDSYKFVSTATSGDAATGSDAVTVGALTGVYAQTTVPSGSYILYASDTQPVGFYKVDGQTNYVAPYRAYLTADGAGARLGIDFSNDETTSISEKEIVKSEKSAAAPSVYDLQGRRVRSAEANYSLFTIHSSLKPGVYIVNGKKYVVK